MFLGPLDHPDIQVHSLEESRLKLLLDEIGTGAPAASHLQNNGPRLKLGSFHHPANFQTLLEGP
jgi:hypothetical protein